MSYRLFFIRARQSLHFGSDQQSGIVDTPIAREKASGLPVGHESQVRGALRHHFWNQFEFGNDKSIDEQSLKQLFGPKPVRSNHEDYDTTKVDVASELAPGQAMLLCLPVVSAVGVMAWVTCPMVLYELAEWIESQNSNRLRVPRCDEDDKCLVINNPDDNKVNSALIINSNRCMFAYHFLSASACSLTHDWAMRIARSVYPDNEDRQQQFCQRFAIVSDNKFVELGKTAVEQRTRRSGDQDDALWIEENLPIHTLMCGVIDLHSRENEDPLSLQTKWGFA